MEKEFIPYEIALKLKKLGFDEPCAACYGSYTHKTSELFLNINNPVNIETLVREKTGFNRPTFYVKSPTFSQAFRWFREEYKIDAWVVPFKNLDDEKQYSYIIDELSFIEDPEDFYTYEEAELDCLKKLIEIVKDEK